MKLFRRKVQAVPNQPGALGELDLYLIAEGRHEELWKVLGSHVQRDKDGNLLGTSFALWAPNARDVSLISDNNFWDRNTHRMWRIENTGIWQIFIADLAPGTKYKFAVHTNDGRWVDHADPMARATEIPPLTASSKNPLTVGTMKSG